MKFSDEIGTADQYIVWNCLKWGVGGVLGFETNL